MDTLFIPLRSMKHLWDFAHFPVFACLALLVLTFVKPVAKQKFELQLVTIICLSFITGLLIEIIQEYVGRYFQWRDICWDVLGAMFTVFIFGNRSNYKYRKSYPAAFAVFISFSVVASLPFFETFIDERRAREEFPVLADFSSKLQIHRFGRNRSIRITDEGLEKRFSTRTYSGFFLNYFPRDWSGYHSIDIHLDNHALDKVELTCRIHEWGHHVKYSDRFNRTYTIPVGSYTLSIDLDQVRKAPAERMLDMTRVGGLGCFTVSLAKPLTMVIRSMKLH